MDISIIIVTRNTCALTGEAIQSALESRDTYTKEIIVVDNGSSDDTPGVIPKKFPFINFMRSEKNLGFAKANNLGAKSATGEFILLLNSDAKLQPESLVSAVEWMKKHPECGIVGAQLLNPDGSRQNSIANFPTLATELLNKSLLRRLAPQRFPGKEQHFTEPVSVETVIGAFMLIRKTVWDQISGFDERYFFFFEETDFCLQVRRRGKTTIHLPHVKVWHAQGQSAKKVLIPARVEYWRSRYFYFKKNHGGLTRQWLAAGLLVRLGGNWLGGFLTILVTLGQNVRFREKWNVHHALVKWHLSGCPGDWGLPR